jgi:hypothetical protein
MSTTPLSIITEICRLSGLNIRSLAAYLQVEESRLGKYSRNTRMLPPEAVATLSRLYAAFMQITELPTPLLTAAQATVQVDKANDCLMQCAPLRKQLAQLQADYRQGCALAQWAAQEVALHGNSFTPRQQRWHAEQLYRARLAMDKNGAAAQLELRIKIAMLELEAGMRQQAMQENV